VQYVETAAALAQARRIDRITARTHRAAVRLLDQLWGQLDIVEVDQQLVAEAASLALRFGLAGYDAVHCASARQLDDRELVAATGDRQLLQAWTALGLATYDTNQPG
jgi:hypothetical protein